MPNDTREGPLKRSFQNSTMLFLIDMRSGQKDIQLRCVSRSLYWASLGYRRDRSMMPPVILVQKQNL